HTPKPTKTPTQRPTVTPTPTATHCITHTPKPTKTPTQRPTVTPTSTADCTFTQGFWKNHPGSWPVSSLSIGGVIYSKAQVLKILQTHPRGDVTFILAHQLIAAKLNIARGADGSVVAAAIVSADAWLSIHPLGSKPTGLARSIGTEYAELLDAFNSGAIGPGHCDEIDRVPAPAPSVEPHWQRDAGRFSSSLRLAEDDNAAFDFPSSPQFPLKHGEL
ncbi:MAG: hypothetical protein WCP22_04625, partial [Chlamydiota bacterium]